MLPHKVTGKLTYPTYQTACHSSTEVSVYLLLYGRDPPALQGVTQLAFDSLSYPAVTQARLAELQDFVHANIAKSAANQKFLYDHHTNSASCKQGEPVWLAVPTAGKLEPHREGGWVIKSLKSPVNVEICDDKQTKVVHCNTVVFQAHWIPPLDLARKVVMMTRMIGHAPPAIEHLILPPEEGSLQSTSQYPLI